MRRGDHARMLGGKREVGRHHVRCKITGTIGGGAGEQDASGITALRQQPGVGLLLKDYTHIEADAQLFQWDRHEFVDIDAPRFECGLGVRRNETPDQVGPS